MSHLILPKNYDPLIDLMESQRAINKRLLSAGAGLRPQLEACISPPLRRSENGTQRQSQRRGKKSKFYAKGHR